MARDEVPWRRINGPALSTRREGIDDVYLTFWYLLWAAKPEVNKQT